MAKIIDTPHTTEDGIDLCLRRYEDGPRTPVLLLHGASAGRQTFEFPQRASFVDYLIERTTLEPWLLDWRCSKNVTERHRRAKRPFGDKFNFDAVATFDIPLALRLIREKYPVEPIRIVGHCMGAETLSRAIAMGELERDSLRPDRIVLSAIGLFYEVAVDGRLKAEDHMLERLRARRDGSVVDFIDPTCKPDGGGLRHPWPKELEEMYAAWPDWFKPHLPHKADTSREGSATSGGDGDRDDEGDAVSVPKHIAEMCNRVSFMFGEPYYEPALHPELHASATELIEQFGLMPLPMYLHAAQCVRRRWAAPFDEGPMNDSRINATARSYFNDIQVLLVTGAMNRLWHRDSIDRMYEWLKRGESRGSDRYRKLVFRKNGHQDLFWGKNSWSEIFPKIADFLTA